MNTLNPGAHVLIGLRISQVERYNDPICLAIELIRKISESVLTSRVPQLDADLCAIWCLVLRLDEVDANGSNML